jgi:hypothetical protein
VKKPKPPKDLTPEARALWNKTLQNWPVGKEETLLCCLRSACNALMRLRRAEASLTAQGGDGTFMDRWSQPRQHPLCTVIRDTSKTLREELKMLSLDWEVLNKGGSEGDEDLELPEPESE